MKTNPKLSFALGANILVEILVFIPFLFVHFLFLFIFALFYCIDSIDMSHTILLVQPGARPETRTYCDYESVNECMEGVCKIYEEHLKRRNPNTPTITYDISQLFDFIDTLIDISCLVYQKSTNTYAPYNKDWIKEKIYVLLRQAAFSPNA